MDKELVKLVRQDTPTLNPTLARGLAYERIKHVERYINDVFRSAAKGFPEGLRYLGCARCTPAEEYAHATRKRSSRRGMRRKKSGKTHDTARTDVYLMKYFFGFDDPTTGHQETLDTVYLYLPFASPGGTIYINDSRFNISPVLADRVMSVSNESIFVRILRDRITFRRLDHMVDINGQHEIIRVVHSLIHHSDGRKQKLKQTVNAKTCMMHYLLCKYGFTETFQRFTGCTPVVGTNLTTVDFPEDQWVICKSVFVGTARRLTQRRVQPHMGHDNEAIMLAFRREEFTDRVKCFVGGFYYVFDHLPFLMRMAWLDDVRPWRVMMGHILWSGDMNAGELVERVTDHITSLDEYVDSITQAQMADIGLDVKDIYEFFAIVIEKYNSWYIEGSGRINSMYDKELMVLYYVLLDISKAVFGFAFDVKAASKKGLTRENIQKAMMKHLRPQLIYQMNRMSNIVTSAGYAGDNMAFKLTPTMVPQSASARTPGRGDSGRSAADDDSQTLHVSVAEVASYSAMTKQDPSGRSRLNLAVHTNHKDVIVRNPALVKTLDAAQEVLEIPYSAEIEAEDADDIDDSDE
jgi:hypothetical protein